jgi:hypothetical protein
VPYLGKQELLRPQLPHESFQLSSADVVFKCAQVDLRSRTIQNANPKAIGCICTIGAFFLADGDKMAGLVVRKQLCIHQRTVRVYFVQLAEIAVDNESPLEYLLSISDDIPSHNLVLCHVFTHLALGFIRSKSHLSAESCLRLIDASHFVACRRALVACVMP